MEHDRFDSDLDVLLHDLSVIQRKLPLLLNSVNAAFLGRFIDLKIDNLLETQRLVSPDISMDPLTVDISVLKVSS